MIPRFPRQRLSLKFSKLHSRNRMVLDLLDNQVIALACRQYVLPKVNGIDRFPDLHGSLSGFCWIQIGIAVEVGLWILKNGLLEGKKAIHIPLPDIFLPGVQENRKIEEV